MADRHTPETFWSRADRSNLDGCWPWLLRINRLGYGQITYQDRRTRAHVIAYELTYGEVPAGLEIDHLCSNRACVNPAHLEAVTHAENVRRGFARRTHCRNGHLLSGDNLMTTGRRRCKKCATAAQSRHVRVKWEARTRHGTLRGTQHSHSKLTDDRVREIRASAETTAALARRFGVSWPVVDFVRKGKTWTHVS